MRKTIYSEDYERLLARLRELRQQAGLRQADLAVRLDRPQSFVSKYEIGERRLDLIELREVSRALATSLSALLVYLEHDEDRPDKPS